MGASILVAVMLSAGISVYVASKFLDEYSHKLDRIESRVDALDTKLRTYRNDLTRVQTKFEAQDDTTMPDRLQKLGRRTDTLETDVEDIEAELELLQQN
jgi:outer membrane murein-binding lipoprotein Lpp